MSLLQGPRKIDVVDITPYRIDPDYPLDLAAKIGEKIDELARRFRIVRIRDRVAGTKLRRARGTFLSMMYRFACEPEEFKLTIENTQAGYTRPGAESFGSTYGRVMIPVIRGERRIETDFSDQNLEPIVPRGYEQDWIPRTQALAEVRWGTEKAFMELLALGKGLPRDHYTAPLEPGQHIVSCTIADLRDYLHKLARSLIGPRHKDLNAVTGQELAMILVRVVGDNQEFEACGGLQAWDAEGNEIDIEESSEEDGDCYMGLLPNTTFENRRKG